MKKAKKPTISANDVLFVAKETRKTLTKSEIAQIIDEHDATVKRTPAEFKKWRFITIETQMDAIIEKRKPVKLGNADQLKLDKQFPIISISRADLVEIMEFEKKQALAFSDDEMKELAKTGEIICDQESLWNELQEAAEDTEDDRKTKPPLIKAAV